ncbi:unnamed protein product [Urochloa decumbens]|uniref:Ubiquitin-like protease family profile domain-containing protein n=1 Tax=Urochloa decumbens TaxID=240449 RepID=A0ABC9B4V0_9POAL
MLDELDGVAWFGQDLREFATENLAGKLTENRVSALIAYGMRCDTNFETLKKSLMKDSLTLVEQLMCGPFGDPKQSCPPVGRSQSYDGDNGLRSRSKRAFDHTDEILNKGYESATEDPKKKKKEKHPTGTAVHDNISTTDVVSGTEDDCVGKKDADNLSPTASALASQQVSFEPPSFDLGIDYQTQEKYMLAKKQLAKGGNAVLNFSNNSSTLPEQDNQHPATVEFSLFGGTPASVKRKLHDVSFKGTPEQKANTSATSPASMSKLLAHAAEFAQIIKCQDELDVNIKPWEHETTDSPVSKQLVEVCRLSKSPWYHGMKHNLCGVASAGRIFDGVLNTSDDDLQKSWIVHRIPRYLEVSGVYLKRSFKLEEPMSYDTYDLALRRIIQLDASMYQNCSDKRWRHILESDFATLSQADEKPCYHKTIREQFYGTSVDYKLGRCRMIVIPANVLNTWCCYFWDFKKKVVHILDPFYKVEEAEYYQKLHEPIADKVGADLANCIEMLFENWSVEWSEWSKAYINPVVKPEHRNESGLLSLLALREFDGENFRNMTVESYNQFKMVLLAEMLSMEGNEAKPPVEFIAEREQTRVIHTID